MAFRKVQYTIHGPLTGFQPWQASPEVSLPCTKLQCEWVAFVWSPDCSKPTRPTIAHEAAPAPAPDPAPAGGPTASSPSPKPSLPARVPVLTARSSGGGKKRLGLRRNIQTRSISIESTTPREFKMSAELSGRRKQTKVRVEHLRCQPFLRKL